MHPTSPVEPAALDFTTSSAPLVSVIVPAHNAETYLERTLRSVLTQTHRKLEILVVDDGSTDRTVEIVERVRSSDARVSLLRQKNRGAAAARNLAIAHASGEYVAPLDADDLWYPQNIERQVEKLRASDAAVAYSWSMDIDECDAPTGAVHVSRAEDAVFATLLCHNFLGNASSSLIRRRALMDVGGYDLGFPDPGCEDWDLHLRLAERHRFRVVPLFLVGYRRHPGAISANRDVMAASHAWMLSRVRERHPRIPLVLLRMSRSSFLIHLAWQSYHGGEIEHAARWLRDAIHHDRITPWLRPGCYALAARCALASLGGHDPRLSPRGRRVRTPETLQRTFRTRYKLAADLTFHLLIAALSSASRGRMLDGRLGSSHTR